MLKTSRIKSCAISFSLSAVVLISAAVQVAGGEQPPFGDASVLATVPTPPGFPEGIAVRGNTVFVAGPATFGTAGDGQPSRVLGFDLKTGALVKNFAAVGENLSFDHANSCIAFD